MFKVLTKCLNIDELRVLVNMWIQMTSSIAVYTGCSECSTCKFKRLCNALYNTEEFLKKELAKREKESWEKEKAKWISSKD